MISATVTVSSAAIPIVGVGAAVKGGQRVLIKNTHATDKLIIGGSGVAANNGYGIDAGQTLDIGAFLPGLNIGAPARETDAVYAIRGGSADIAAQVLAIQA
jgi:hypothetical protein